MLSSWGNPVCLTSFFESNWSSIPKGSICDIVCNMVCWSEKPSGLPCRVLNLLIAANSASPIAVFRVALDNGLGGEPTFVFDERSHLCVHHPLQAHHYLNLVEFCARLGASSVGLSEAGFSLNAAVEWNEPMASLHRRVHEGVPDVQGDIGDVQTLVRVKEVCDEPFCLMVGISCQPYSRGGSQAGGFDNRAQTVPAVSKACHVLQVPLLILECATPAKTNAFVRSHLEHVCQRLGMKLSECVLQLEDTWASNLSRWWVVATNLQFGVIPLPALPGPGRFVVRCSRLDPLCH